MAESNIEDNEPHYQFTRCSSTGSLHAITSSANTSDDEDSDLGNPHPSIKDRRREAHTQAEQKRRDAIKKGYDCLQELVPMCQPADNSQSYKLSKATVLQKSVDYIHYMQNCKRKQDEEVAALNKEVFAMTIIKMNYDHIVSAHQSQPGNHLRQVSDDVKFEVFRALVDSLFKTFDLSVTANNFAEISGSVIQWVEEHCKPQILREVLSGVLRQLRQHEMLTSSAHNQNVAISHHGSVVGPLGSAVGHLNTSNCNIAPALNNGSSGHVLDASTGCSVTPVLYTSPDCRGVRGRTIAGSFMN